MASRSPRFLSHYLFNSATFPSPTPNQAPPFSVFLDVFIFHTWPPSLPHFFSSLPLSCPPSLRPSFPERFPFTSSASFFSHFTSYCYRVPVLLILTRATSWGQREDGGEGKPKEAEDYSTAQKPISSRRWKAHEKQDWGPCWGEKRAWGSEAASHIEKICTWGEDRFCRWVAW